MLQVCGLNITNGRGSESLFDRKDEGLSEVGDLPVTQLRGLTLWMDILNVGDACGTSQGLLWQKHYLKLPNFWSPAVR